MAVKDHDAKGYLMHVSGSALWCNRVVILL